MEQMKKAYITPVTRWMWIGLDEEVAGQIDVVTNSKTHGSSSGMVKGEMDFTDEENVWGNVTTSEDLWNDEW